MNKWHINPNKKVIILNPFSWVLSTLTGRDSPGFQAKIFPNPTWRCRGSNQGPFACKAEVLSFSYAEDVLTKASIIDLMNASNH